MDTIDQRTLSQALLTAPFDQKWDILRPVIQQLYIGENRKLSDVIKCMKERHNFDATEHQYKFRFGKWKIKKGLSNENKRKLCENIQLKTRAQAGRSSVMTYKGQVVDKTNLRRYLKDETRIQTRERLALQPVARGMSGNVNGLAGYSPLFGNRIFMNWNMPYGPKRSTIPRAADHHSPLSDFVVATPASANSAPSPTAAAIRTRSAMDNARLFLEGRHIELLKTMEHQQRVTMSTWMHQFWLFSYKTAKHWGHGPHNWTANLLGLDNHQQRIMVSISSPHTPASCNGTPAAVDTPMDETMSDLPGPDAQRGPSKLCRWSIHVKSMLYDPLHSPSPPETVHVDLENEETWPRWSAVDPRRTFAEKLTDGLESNDFSNVRHDDLPIAVNQIVNAAKTSSDELDKEALGFSIMSRNIELMGDLLERMQDKEYEGHRSIFDASGLYPFHLAITYLDGAKTCCNVLDELEQSHPIALQKSYVNDLGHTLLDQLMMNILKAHTSCTPAVADNAFKKQRRFQGEDVDICGRWDADSDCVRSLLAKGNSAIPFEWKHMFCHTSVQTICHSIGTIFGPCWTPDINTRSGLFVRRCSHCGLKLQNMPLHTLILVSLHLAWSGCQDETLFGILACLVCLLHNGANPLLKASISLGALIGSGEADECDHIELDPLELAEKIPLGLTQAWSSSLQTGWQAVCSTLKHAQAEWGLFKTPRYCSRHDDYMEDSEDEMDAEIGVDEPPDYTYHPCGAMNDPDYTKDEYSEFFGRSKVFGTLWAAIQTELLTYRRLEEGDPWISSNFDMDSLNQSLVTGDHLAIALVQENMMKPFCGCGRFWGAEPACPVVEDAAAHHFINFDCWSRSTYITVPENRETAWYV